MEIGKTMRQLREQRGISVRSLAESLGITRSALYKIEAGKTEPKTATIRKFCATLKIPLAYLYTKSFTPEDFTWPVMGVLIPGAPVAERLDGVVFVP